MWILNECENPTNGICLEITVRNGMFSTVVIIIIICVQIVK